MIELFEQNVKTFECHSSKGNQLKWKNNDTWYKADYMGYEGLVEYLVSNLLDKSTLRDDEYVKYEIEEIHYKHKTFTGVRSENFLEEGWQLITLERLYKNQNQKSLYDAIWKLENPKERCEFIINAVKTMTGINDFDIYLAKLITIDALFLNEDRHLHNVAVLMNEDGEYKLCPIFDNGASLLSDSKLDYPLDIDVIELMGEVKAKTFSSVFDEQIDVVEEMCGQALHFTFTRKDVDELLLLASSYYERSVIERVRTVMYQQIRKYSYLFTKN